jgi:hypothetical protein
LCAAKRGKRNERAAVRGKTKAAVLEGDPDCKDLVAFNVYDTKPVHFLSTACTSLSLKKKSKRGFDRDAGINAALKFLRTDMPDDYNHMLNHVDQADQLRGSCHVDKWTRNRKWWWSIWMWGIDTACKFLRVVPRNSPFDVEDKKAKAFNPLPVSKINSACMGYWK